MDATLLSGVVPFSRSIPSFSRVTPWVGALILGLAGWAHAEDQGSYAVGDLMAPIQRVDQHGQPAKVDATARWILFSRDMEGGEVLKASMADQDEPSLTKLGAVYVADIHRMSAWVSRIMAIPRMRERSYPILLDHDGEKTARIPTPEGHATLMALDALRVRTIHHFSDARDLRRQLGIQEAPAQDPAATSP